MQYAKPFSTLALLGLALAAHAQTYDLAADFSIANGNPNGVWTYGTLNGSTFVPTAANDRGTNTTFNLDFWNASVAIFKNKNSSNAFGIGPGQISLGADAGTPMARFTAPTAGLYSFELAIGGTMAGDAFGGGNRRVGFSRMAINGVLNPAFTEADNVRTWTAPAVALAAGGTLDAYVIGSGSFGNTQTRFTVQSVPEPATLAILGVGALGLLKRRRKA